MTIKKDQNKIKLFRRDDFMRRVALTNLNKVIKMRKSTINILYLNNCFELFFLLNNDI